MHEKHTLKELQETGQKIDAIKKLIFFPKTLSNSDRELLTQGLPPLPKQLIISIFLDPSITMTVTDPHVIERIIKAGKILIVFAKKIIH